MSPRRETDQATIPEKLVREVHSSGVLAKLNRLSRTTAGLVLVVLIRTERELVEVHPAGPFEQLPTFCQIFRSTSDGEKRCLTCRSLVALAACYRGPLEYTCHGGTAVFAAPALRRDGRQSDRVVVATCAVARGCHARGWRTVSSHAAGLGFDVRQLKEAYHELPAFADSDLPLVQGIVDLAASILGDLEDRLADGCGSGASSPEHVRSDRDNVLVDFPVVLSQTRDPSLRAEGSMAGAALVDLVIAMVKRDPSMRYSVVNIARAACVTPNHFSTLFRKHMGMTFSDFLTDERIARARELLGDLRLSVSDVARRSGFDDPAYFSRRFRKITGVAPSQWRNDRGVAT